MISDMRIKKILISFWHFLEIIRALKRDKREILFEVINFTLPLAMRKIFEE